MDDRQILKPMQLFSDAYEQDCQVLQQMPLFSGFYEAEIDALIRSAAKRSVPDGHVFLSMGAVNASIFVICEGSVKVERSGTRDANPIATLGVGQSFGEMSFMDGSLASATVTAIEPTKAFELSREAIDAMIEGYAPLALKFWRNLALVLRDRLSKTNEVIDRYIDINEVLLQNKSFRELYNRS